MWLEAPNSSAAPHFDGHQGCALSFGAAGCACAAETGASAYLPCAGPANGAARAAPAAPTAPAVFRKARRFGDAGELSGVSVGSVIAVPPSPHGRLRRFPPDLPARRWKTIRLRE